MDGPEAAVVVDEVLLVKAEVEITAGLALIGQGIDFREFWKKIFDESNEKKI